MHALAEEGAGQNVRRRVEGHTRDKKFSLHEKEKGREKKRRKRGERFSSPSLEGEMQRNYFALP